MTPHSSASSAPIYGQKVAIWLGEALLIAFAATIAFVGMDNARRTTLETYEETTAVGDHAYFPVTELQKAGEPAVTFKGKSLIPVDGKPVEIRDSKMLRLTKEDSGRFYVYGTREALAPQEGERKGEVFFFLKVAQNEYLKTRAEGTGK